MEKKWKKVHVSSRAESPGWSMILGRVLARPEPELDDALLYWGGFEAGTRGGAAAVFGPWFAGFPGRLGGSKWRCLAVIDGIQYVGLTTLWVFVLGAWRCWFWPCLVRWWWLFHLSWLSAVAGGGRVGCPVCVCARVGSGVGLGLAHFWAELDPFWAFVLDLGLRLWAWPNRCYELNVKSGFVDP